MNLSYNLRSSLGWFTNSVSFFKNNFSKVITLALVAAFGRTIQLGAFGEISRPLHISLEVIIETSRLLIFCYTLGLTDLKTGFGRITQFFTRKSKRQQYWTVAMHTLRTDWLAVLLNLVVFSVVTYFINYLINLTAYETCMLVKLKAGNIISATSSEWVLLLFFKNLSVIPFTLIFNAVFLLWLTNKLKRSPVKPFNVK